MNFFTSKEDLAGWIKSQESPDNAATKISDILRLQNPSFDNTVSDIKNTCNDIFNGADYSAVDSASEVLFGVLSKSGLSIKKVASSNHKIQKEAQMMRQDGAYSSMPLRICPKLPYSVGKRLISTYNCRHYCLDSMTFDDDPMRVYCMESLWRQSVMDKFSSDFKDKDGKLVGGYINQRFQVYHDDGGNPMELSNSERTRAPRPHQYSTERRLEEARGEKTKDIIVSAIKSNKVVKLASTEKTEEIKDTKVFEMFRDAIEMKEDGLSDEDIIFRIADHYEEEIDDVAKIHAAVSKKLMVHASTVYEAPKKINKVANLEPISETVNTNVGSPTYIVNNSIAVNMGNNKTIIENGAHVVLLDQKQGLFQAVDGHYAGSEFKLLNSNDMSKLAPLDTSEEHIQNGGNEVGLNEHVGDNSADDFPIVNA